MSSSLRDLCLSETGLDDSVPHDAEDVQLLLQALSGAATLGHLATFHAISVDLDVFRSGRAGSIDVALGGVEVTGIPVVNDGGLAIALHPSRFKAVLSVEALHIEELRIRGRALIRATSQQGTRI